MADSLLIRKAEKKDSEIILYFINQLAKYEKLEHEVEATEELIEKNIFGEGSNVEALICYRDDKPVAFAVYFYNFSTFLAKPGLYLEDIFVLPEMRGKGIGKKMLTHIAKIAVEKGCGRFEWAVLDWNEPAINFYKSIGAVPMDEWTIFRLTGEPLLRLADSEN
ncbi:MAG: GNAT family N-acetyltransferase [Ignavibacteria bacterium]|jgi:GNAT superfamily N-acetyltransferase